MDVNSLMAKIRQLHSDATQQQETTGDAIADAKIEGYLFGVNTILEIIKEEKDFLRLQQQLARKKEQLQQGPNADLGQLIGRTIDGSTKTKDKGNVIPFQRSTSTSSKEKADAHKQTV